MAWIESHQNLRDHPKVFQLAELMGWDDPDLAIGKLHRFWWWCVDYSREGDISHLEHKHLARGLGMSVPEADRFVVAMVKTQWLTRAAGRLFNTEWPPFSRTKKLEQARKDKHARRARLEQVENTLTEPDWQAIVDYHGSRCAYCLRPLNAPVLEHMTPISRGGGNTVENVVPACKSCNSRKGAKTPLEFICGLKQGEVRHANA